MYYSREATANRVPGLPIIFTASGRFESAPVVENVEVAAAAGGGGDDDDNDDDNDDDDDDDDGNVSSLTDRKRKAMGGPGGHYDDRKQKPRGRSIKHLGWP